MKTSSKADQLTTLRRTKNFNLAAHRDVSLKKQVFVLLMNDFKLIVDASSAMFLMNLSRIAFLQLHCQLYDLCTQLQFVRLIYFHYRILSVFVLQMKRKKL